jgi:hypothetical protein
LVVGARVAGGTVLGAAAALLGVTAGVVAALMLSPVLTLVHPAARTTAANPRPAELRRVRITAPSERTAFTQSSACSAGRATRQGTQQALLGTDPRRASDAVVPWTIR